MERFAGKTNRWKMCHGGQDRGTGHAGVSGRQEDRTEKQIRQWEQACLRQFLNKFASHMGNALSDDSPLSPSLATS
jgi:hypothetical protein